MNYEDIAASAEHLSYRDKFRLAQLLIQLARKEEEEQNPEKRVNAANSTSPALESDLIEYVAQRLQKLRPSKKSSLLNAIAAMFQFQGGISDSDKEKFVAALLKNRRISIDQNNRVSYPD